MTAKILIKLIEVFNHKQIYPLQLFSCCVRGIWQQIKKKIIH